MCHAGELKRREQAYQGGTVLGDLASLGSDGTRRLRFGVTQERPRSERHRQRQSVHSNWHHRVRELITVDDLHFLRMCQFVLHPSGRSSFRHTKPGQGLRAALLRPVPLES